MKPTSYNPKIVAAYFTSLQLPEPVFEHQFNEIRKWRFDLAWPDHRLGLEVQGGLFIQGAHARGAAIAKDHEKRNYAAAAGWRILYCQPRELMTLDMARYVRVALAHRTG